MIDLYLLCTDLKNPQSNANKVSKGMIQKIYNILRNPSLETEEIITEWKNDFRYIYGDVNSNLSSNSKLNIEKLFDDYGINDIDMNAANTQMLFFAVQTYFSLLIKVLMKQIIAEDETCSYGDMVLCHYMKKHGIDNYCKEDWYCWPIFELCNGMDSVLVELDGFVSEYKTVLSVGEFVTNNNYDFIKQMYEAIIPKELRHALGEYYTPDWLAEKTLYDALELYNSSIADISIIDPTCGSGTFLFKTIIEKKKITNNLSDILNTVKGIDINPLAILTAKTNYLLAIMELLDEHTCISIPIYNADIIYLSQEIDDSIEETEFIHNPVNTIRYNMIQDRITARGLEKADIVLGNPPWVNWEYMPEEYRIKSQHFWIDYSLFSAKGRDLSFSKEDISVLITYIVMDILLKENGIIGFVIRQGTFKSAQNGVGFRRFKIKDDCDIKVLKVDDLSKIRAFDNATNSTALFYAQKNAENIYPIPYYLWLKRDDLKKCSFNSYSELREVLSQMNITEQRAIPSVGGDITSLWLTADSNSLEKMQKVLGENEYKARTGVFTGGANAVYWLSINSTKGNNIEISNITERAKRKAESVTAEIEKEFVFPMVKGSTVRKWHASYDSYLLCPHTAETKMWPVSKSMIEQDYPLTYDYLLHFKEDLDGRNGFAGWEKEIQKKEFHAILRIGEYTFSKYKVIWKYIASEFICAVISDTDDKYLGRKLLIPNEKIMYVSTEDENEAYYLCGILSSSLVANCVESFMNPTSISAHVLDKLNIPTYDSTNDFHNAIARLCKEGHETDNIEKYIAEIDRIVEEHIYN